ncbi:MAG TPA: nucleotidyl transferase AbiEii/AbiGii toxin family protein [Egibacteraceae bacterium]|nr:nucleotidyl transferase AbiEii/AbiGii toxin family protein [Egibacteraceae bacterium]
MLAFDEERRWASALGVPPSQVRRDHLLSHVLHALPHVVPEATFIGGTALCRTYLPDWRVSEDIDLLVSSAGRSADQLSGGLPPLLRREFPGLHVTWRPEGATHLGHLAAGDLTIRVQLVPSDSSYRRYPTALTSVALRYGDLPAAVELSVPTRAGMAAMKLNAWADRAAPRDLCDLFGLVQAGALCRDAISIAGEASAALQPAAFGDGRLPVEEEWVAALGAQMPVVPDRELAFHRVRVEVSGLCGWDRPEWRDGLRRVEGGR